MMAYQDRSSTNSHRITTPHSQNFSRGGHSVHFQGTKELVNGYAPPSNGQLPTNGQYEPRYATVKASYQHRALTTPTTQQPAPQKAYAVAIPPPVSSTNASAGHTTTLKGLQPTQANPSQFSTNATHAYPSKPASQQTRANVPLDYQLLLLSLAEEYFAAAYSYSSTARSVNQEADFQEYYKLIATGLGCLEAVLSHFKLFPEREAVVRLRYATVLYKETENTMEAEEALSKGVSLCDRHRLFDLKYNMQHLLARLLFEKSPRAAFRFLDGITKDVEAYQHIAWIYAFRFLKVSLYLHLSTHQSTLLALSQLKQIVNLSKEYGDKAILAIATILEALTSLRESNSVDGVEQAQRALASVRSLQLDPKIGKLHQLAVLTSIIDLCCHLQQFDPVHALARMRIMQNAMKEMDESKSWAADGSLAIPIPNARTPFCTSQNGIVRQEGDSSLVLMFDWMARDDIYNLGHFLSGIALTHRNTQDGRKSEQMLENGIEKLKHAHKDTGKPTLPMSIMLAASHQTWHEQITCYMRLHLAFMQCARTMWSAAKEQQSLIQTSIQSMTTSSDSIPQSLLLLVAYLQAVIYQGTGDLDQALNVYQSNTMSIQTYRKTAHPSQIHQDVTLLSALNTVLVIRSPNHPNHEQLPSLLSFVEPLCVRNPNHQIQSAYHLLAATTSSSSTILLTKQALQYALQFAKQTENSQLMCIVLNLMSWKFFRGVVGEQSEKSARASQRLAQKCMDGLWMSVAAGVLGDTLEAAGRIEEAKSERERGEIAASTLPEVLQLAMKQATGNEDEVMAG